MFRRLTVPFDDLETFRRELEWHIAQGGIFVPTQEQFQLREVVEVQLDLRFCEAAPVFEGEVVNQVRPGRGSQAPIAGVALQFLDPAPKLRAELESITGLQPPAPVIPDRPGPSRRHERSPARVAVRVELEDRRFETYTLNVSRSGLLIPIEGDPIPIGRRMRITLTHPRTSEVLRVTGRVVRHEISGSRVSALGVQLEPDPAQREAQGRFLEDSSAAAHARDLGGIRGDLAAVGVPSLLQMFPGSAVEGTIELVHANGDHGRVLFQNGLLRHASVSGVEGLKAVSRMAGWDAGQFAFTPSILPGEPSAEPISIEHALLDALTHHDELQSLDLRAVPREALLECADGQAPGAEPKLEQALIDQLARPRRVADLVDATPAFDVEVYRALLALLESGALRRRG